MLRAVPTLASLLTPDIPLGLFSRPETSPRVSRFVDVGRRAGLSHPCVYGSPSHATYILENMGPGCAFFDYDNDGWIDILALNGRRLEGTPAETSNRLYHNNRDGTFTDVTSKAGLFDSGWANGVCIGDYDNDGFEDIFIT